MNEPEEHADNREGAIEGTTGSVTALVHAAGRVVARHDEGMLSPIPDDSVSIERLRAAVEAFDPSAITVK